METIVKVTAYTSRGLYANDREFHIADEHRLMPGFDLMMLFKRGDQSIRQYALSGEGFVEGFQYLIEIRRRATYGGEVRWDGRFISNFILDKRKCTERETIPCLAY